MTSAQPSGFPPSSPTGRLLAQVWQLIGEKQFAEAIGPMREAAAMQPDNARIHTDLGRLCLEAGRPMEAVAPLRRAIELDPQLAIAYWRLGMALQLLRETEGAIDALERAVQLEPNLSDAHYRLGLLNQIQGRPLQALESYRQAARTAPERAARQFIQARVFMLEGREGEAEALLRRAIEQPPPMEMAQGLLGEILAGQGHFDEAAKFFEAELDVSPGAGIVYYNLVRCRPITTADETLIRRMDAALERDGLNDYNRSNLLLARGKAFADLGRYDKAMADWDSASLARARIVPFDIEIFEKAVDAIVETFSVEAFARYASSGSGDRTPLLILGMPRSGTTLCEQIVSSHPQVAGVGELSFWDARLQRALQDGLEPEAITESASQYLAVLAKLRERGGFSSAATRISDKDPFNFFSIGLIHLAFPRAAIIHCRRNAVDTALSIHQTHFATWNLFPTGGEDLVRYFRAYERLMAHWREVLPPGRMLEVDYETLTASPDSAIRTIIDYVGLDWNDACLSPQDNARVVRTPSRWQVRQPINTKSVDRGRRYKPWLGPLAALVRHSE